MGSSSKAPARSSKQVKCLVWDLDKTMWSGVLLEGDAVELLPLVRETIEHLDERGILLSIASRNDHDAAWAKLNEFELDRFFLHPQINWGPKSVSVATIAQKLNIGTDAIAFIDDDPFERGEVAASLPGVLCLDPTKLPDILGMGEFTPRFATPDARGRRAMYEAEIERQKVETGMIPEDFLKSLEMVLTISPPARQDLERLEELTLRTNQLNSTGYTYSSEKLDKLRGALDHQVLIAGLDDIYGTYGKVGMAVIEERGELWLLKLLLMSCRVMPRGVGNVLLGHILQRAQAAGKRVQAEFLRTERNRMMYLTFKLAGFRETSRDNGIVLLEHDLETIDPFPGHLTVRVLS